MRRLFLFAIGLAAITGAGCNNDSAVAPSDPGPSSTTQLFNDALAPQGTGFYAFTVTGTQNVSLNFASLTSASSGQALTPSLRLGLGVPAGAGCGVTQSVVTTSGLTGQIAASLPDGIYCVNLTDIGGLAENANFTVRIVIGAPATSSGAGGTDTWSSNLAVHGTATRSFVAAQSGSVSITLNSVDPSLAVGFGLGVWRPDGGGCSLTQSLTSSGGATITRSADSGTYCVKIFDVGNLVDTAGFSVSITRP